MLFSKSKIIVGAISAVVLSTGVIGNSIAGGIKITPSVASVTVDHNGTEVVVERNQDPSAVVKGSWIKTGRRCPPFCVQPIIAAPGVKTVGIGEVVDFMRTDMATGAGTIVDARTSDWYARGTIPGSINFPFTKLNRKKGANDASIAAAFAKFGVTGSAGSWNFSNAKSLVLWCNGWWCGQSPMAIRGLVAEGYPADKLRYYRGGMQNWKTYGMTTVK